jgi:hypothetical protein
MDNPNVKHKPIQLLASSADEGPATERERRLLELAHALDRPHAFYEGQLVRWKPGLKNRGAPAYNEVAVVREVLAAPVFDDCEQARCAGTAHFREPLTFVHAVLDPDGDFIDFHYDGRRFESSRPNRRSFDLGTLKTIILSNYRAPRYSRNGT